jgi:hypothetical protein
MGVGGAQILSGRSRPGSRVVGAMGGGVGVDAMGRGVGAGGAMGGGVWGVGAVDGGVWGCGAVGGGGGAAAPWEEEEGVAACGAV